MKTNLDQLFKTNTGLESSGVWFNFNNKTKFLVRRFGGDNPNMKAAFAKHYKPHARQIDLDTLDPEKEKEILLGLFVDACMIDWKGVEIDGVDVPYSPEVAVKLFRALPELHKTVASYAQDWANFKEDIGAEEALGNS